MEFGETFIVEMHESDTDDDLSKEDKKLLININERFLVERNVTNAKVGTIVLCLINRYIHTYVQYSYFILLMYTCTCMAAGTYSTVMQFNLVSKCLKGLTKSLLPLYQM